MKDVRKPKDWLIASGLLAIMALFYGMASALAADLKIPAKREVAVKAWICGYSAGFEDAIRQPADPRQRASDQCEKFKADAKKVVK